MKIYGALVAAKNGALLLAFPMPGVNDPRRGRAIWSRPWPHPTRYLASPAQLLVTLARTARHSDPTVIQGR